MIIVKLCLILCHLYMNRIKACVVVVGVLIALIYLLYVYKKLFVCGITVESMSV
jgi:hypothetical protein